MHNIIRAIRASAYHLGLVLAIKRDAGRMPNITITIPQHTATRTRASESGGAWFVEWSA